MPTEPKADFRQILRTLTEHHVKYIVVGGVSAVLQGVPFSTFDLDVVHSRDPQNVKRLRQVLDSLESHYRTNPERRAKPNASHLSSAGHQLLMTRFGPLDILGMIGQGHEYQELETHSVKLDIGGGLKVAVLDLKTLIRVKEETGGEKDRATLPLLRRHARRKIAVVAPPSRSSTARNSRVAAGLAELVEQQFHASPPATAG